MAGVAEVVHATCIALDGRAALIRGPSGSGKSDLALRCLGLAANPLMHQSAGLVADDRVMLELVGDRLVAAAPPALHGKLEVRGQGILSLPVIEQAEIVLLADLVPSTFEIDRLPDPVPTDCVCGKHLPVLRLHPFEASSPAKLVMALATQYGLKHK